MKDLGVQQEDRVVVAPSWEADREAQEQNKGNEGIYCGAAIELRDGTIITGNNSPLMHAASSLQGRRRLCRPCRHARQAKPNQRCKRDTAKPRVEAAKRP